MRKSFSLCRLAAAGIGAAGLVLATAMPVSAHVTVSSPDAEPGSFGKLVFRVPNESDSASTTRLRVQLPTDTPFASVSTKPVPGWTVEAEPTRLDRPAEVNGATLTEAVTTITWTAERGSALPPDQFAEFEVSVGPLPENTDSITFPATQTYSDGEVVAWDQVAAEGAAEPEHPAPMLELGTSRDMAAPAAGDADEVDAATSPTAASTEVADGSDGLARALGGVAVVLAAAALAWSLLTGRRRAKG